MTTVWFTSDTHWFHKNINEYSSRPFATVEEMGEALVKNWNSVVSRGDVVYHLGDFAMTWKKSNVGLVEDLVSRLNGQIHLIYGNHDRDAVRNARGFAWKGDYKKIKISGQTIILFHYPIASWHHVHRGAWHLHGHCHGNLVDDRTRKRLDVGVDCWSYMPVSFEQIQIEMEGRTFVPVDHHIENVQEP